ncbi:hypothetical protein AB0I84_29180 [Streptomyces spectabilis]|uniref:hypothetical protein n=1 Tax=Streptomyces spectabilis TaxID=68270 RepID=UPI0033E0005F
MDATTWLASNDYRLFKADKLAVIDTAQGNSITYDGMIAAHGTYANIPPEFKQGIDATTFVNPEDYRLFRGDRLVSIDTTKGNAVAFNDQIAAHGTYANIPDEFKRGIDATSWLSASDYRLFKGDKLVVIDTTRNNSITYNGYIAGHGTYANIPDELKRGIDATTFVSGEDYRLFKGDRLVVVDTREGNSVVYDGRIADHDTYKNLPSPWTS